ncbi:MAG: glycoside hydrolase family 3 C-terminal domain-containing protein [Lachnospiraceae bacterium]|nr:glycoside hydrolase family 3 C-terminal domain-containing protein [Lachnospiraceae bacterium]
MALANYETEHIDKVRDISSECMVLLKSNGDFPLKEAGKVALYGNGARRTIKGGTGSGDVNSRFYVTCEYGLKKAGFFITTDKWMDAYDEICEKHKEAFVKKMKAEAKAVKLPAMMYAMGKVLTEPEYELPIDGEGDVCVYVLSRNSGEGNDRVPEAGDVLLTEAEKRDILKCFKQYKKFILVLNVGGVIDLSDVSEVENILVLSQLGVSTGDALADVLLGKSNPSGKLTTTWSAWKDYSTIGEFGDKNETRYKEGVYVGYRYFDSVGKRALYPFGYGLSYTTFSMECKDVSVEDTKVHLSCIVKNTGAMKGKEVAQLYVTCPWGKLDQPYQKLATYQKTKLLAPGEEEKLELSFGMEEIASYDEESASYLLEKGQYILRLGANSQDTKEVAALELKETVTLRKLSRVGGNTDFKDFVPEKTWSDVSQGSTKVISVDEKAFECLSWPKPMELSKRAKDFVSTLTEEELIYLNIGQFSEKGGINSVIGAQSGHVAGAAGESSSRVNGIAPIIMADGPAGLRLNKEYVKTKDGVKAVGNTMPEGFDDYLSPVVKFALDKLVYRKPKKDVFTQYCTAIPIGTALAQSWSDEVCMMCGDIVGDEMERFGVQLWLAPAFNIHRTPLCGRNFEYCSEDPLISGKVGAAITKGVQKHKNCGTTIKHFCCNNQELSRYQNDSMVSERALREIYLKNFEICIRDSHPMALMTSYNLLNGVHTAEHEDLLKGVLREEWGYEGLVMSDWILDMMVDKSCKNRTTHSAPAMKAGNNVFMPGSTADFNRALKAVKNESEEGYTLTREELEFNAAVLCETSWKLHE